MTGSATIDYEQSLFLGETRRARKKITSEKKMKQGVSSAPFTSSNTLEK